jgi:hypothetical protein
MSATSAFDSGSDPQADNTAQIGKKAARYLLT